MAHLIIPGKVCLTTFFLTTIVPDRTWTVDISPEGGFEWPESLAIASCSGKEGELALALVAGRARDYWPSRLNKGSCARSAFMISWSGISSDRSKDSSSDDTENERDLWVWFLIWVRGTANVESIVHGIAWQTKLSKRWPTYANKEAGRENGKDFII